MRWQWSAMFRGRTEVSQNVGYLAGVDHLRGFAAILMIMYHGYQQLGGPGFARARNPLEAVLIEGHTAVALFLVLSGFIFTYGTLSAGSGEHIRYGPFIRNRVLRIMPMYVLVVFVGMYTNPSGYSLGGIAQLFTLQGTPPIATADLGSFGALLWTISVEFAFYLVFPFLVLFLQRGGPWQLVRLIVVMNVLRELAHAVHPEGVRDLSYWTIVGRMDQFLVGMLLAWMVVKYKPVWSAARSWASFAAACVLVVAAIDVFNRNGGWAANVHWKVFWPLAEGVIWAVFIGTYLLASRSLRKGAAAAIALPGIVSYSAYLLHYVLVTVVRDHGPVAFFGAGRANALVNTLVVVLPATFALAALTYHTIEKPFMGLRGRYFQRSG